jgi:hypothetical protein
MLIRALLLAPLLLPCRAAKCLLVGATLGAAVHTAASVAVGALAASAVKGCCNRHAASPGRAGSSATG